MIKITSKLHGVEVGGMRHPTRTVHYTDDQISDEQLAEMRQSEYLTVEADGDSVIRLASAFDGDRELGADVVGETLPPFDASIKRVAEGVQDLTEAERIAQAKPDPEAPAAPKKARKTTKK